MQLFSGVTPIPIKKAGAQLCACLFYWYWGLLYLLFLRKRVVVNPKRPMPNSSIVAGSRIGYDAKITLPAQIATIRDIVKAVIFFISSFLIAKIESGKNQQIFLVEMRLAQIDPFFSIINLFSKHTTSGVFENYLFTEEK